MKETTRLNIAAKALFAASQFSDFSIGAAVAEPANEQIGQLLFGTDLYSQYQNGLISAYEYGLNVAKIMAELESRIQMYREREEAAKQGILHARDEITGRPIEAFRIVIG